MLCNGSTAGLDAYLDEQLSPDKIPDFWLKKSRRPKNHAASNGSYSSFIRPKVAQERGMMMPGK